MAQASTAMIVSITQPHSRSSSRIQRALDEYTKRGLEQIKAAVPDGWRVLHASFEWFYDFWGQTPAPFAKWEISLSTVNGGDQSPGVALTVYRLSDIDRVYAVLPSLDIPARMEIGFDKQFDQVLVEALAAQE